MIQLLSTADVAKILSISTKTVHALTKKHGSQKLPCIWIGGSKRFSLKDVEAYANRNHSIHWLQDKRGI